VHAEQVGPPRPWAASDDISALTGLLHSAYKPLLEMGLQYVAASQDDATTAQRIGGGRLCWVIDQPRNLPRTTTSPSW
jgi:hypothetical protein